MNGGTSATTTNTYDVLNRLLTSTGGQTATYSYEVNNQDIQKIMGPRNVPGSFPVVTYYTYVFNDFRGLVRLGYND